MLAEDSLRVGNLRWLLGVLVDDSTLGCLVNLTFYKFFGVFGLSTISDSPDISYYIKSSFLFDLWTGSDCCGLDLSDVAEKVYGCS